jgi:hypothetical protein
MCHDHIYGLIGALACHVSHEEFSMLVPYDSVESLICEPPSSWVVVSMSRKGNCHDNAPVDVSFVR